MIIDACSIILLAKASLLEKFIEWKPIVLSQAVYEEVMEGRKLKATDSLLTDRLVSQGKMKVIEVSDRTLLKKVTDDFGFGKGESQTITIAIEKKLPVITDNKQGRKAAKVYGLGLVGSIEIVVSLYRANKIGKEKALSALRNLQNQGWFTDYLIDQAVMEVTNG